MDFLTPSKYDIIKQQADLEKEEIIEMIKSLNAF